MRRPRCRVGASLTLAALKVHPHDLLDSEPERAEVWKVNPGRSIPPESTRIHGITDADVAAAPLFTSVAGAVYEFIRGCDLLGYSLRKFDVPLLWEEFYRARIEWDLSRTRIIDASDIFRIKEPRTLVAAVKKFCGREHTSAHDVVADVLATLDVLNGERESYPDVGAMTIAGLAEFSCQER